MEPQHGWIPGEVIEQEGGGLQEACEGWVGQRARQWMQGGRNGGTGGRGPAFDFGLLALSSRPPAPPAVAAETSHPGFCHPLQTQRMAMRSLKRS